MYAQCNVCKIDLCLRAESCLRVVCFHAQQHVRECDDRCVTAACRVPQGSYIVDKCVRACVACATCARSMCVCMLSLLACQFVGVPLHTASACVRGAIADHSVQDSSIVDMCVRAVRLCDMCNLCKICVRLCAQFACKYVSQPQHVCVGGGHCCVRNVCKMCACVLSRLACRRRCRCVCVPSVIQ